MAASDLQSGERGELVPPREGVWSIEIRDRATYSPAGGLVLESGHVRGGDSGEAIKGSTER